MALFTERTTQVRAPLLERLIDFEPSAMHEINPMQTLSIDDMRRSVGRELVRLLNTRGRWNEVESAAGRTVIEYGIADFATSYRVLPEQEEPLARVVERTIAAFEPRLRNARARIEPEARDRRKLRLVIDAVLAVEHVAHDVTYQFTLAGKEGSVMLHED